MTNEDFDFETWFDNLAIMVLDMTGIEFRDMDSVEEDYNAGKSVADVAREIADEYGE
jgi:hypothetical protein